MPQAEAAPLTVRVLIDAGAFIGALLTGVPRQRGSSVATDRAGTAGNLARLYDSGHPQRSIRGVDLGEGRAASGSSNRG